MDALLSRPHRRPRRERVLPVGGPGDPADFVVAIRNIEAEILNVNGTRLKDSSGNDLPSILDGIMPKHEQDELLEAVRVARGLSGPKIGIPVTTPFPGPMRRAWDLDALETVFRKASGSVSSAARVALNAVIDETNPFERRVESAESRIQGAVRLVEPPASCRRVRYPEDQVPRPARTPAHRRRLTRPFRSERSRGVFRISVGHRRDTMEVRTDVVLSPLRRIHG